MGKSDLAMCLAGDAFMTRMLNSIVAAAVMAFGAASNAEVISRLEMVSGDRQIAVGTLTPAKPFVLRATSANGTPVVGARLFIGPAADPGFPYVQDQFGFRGFNTVGIVQYGGVGSPSPQYFAVTDTTGQVSGQGQYVDPAPSAFVVAAGQVDEHRATQTLFTVVAVKALPPGRPSVVVEYFHADLRHYFNTLLDAEVAALDAGVFAGWQRSVGAFIAYPSKADAPADAVPVCRFFSSKFTSHFYTADPAECAFVVDNWPDVWQLETTSAFYVSVPDRQTGQCPTGQQPVYRLFNNLPSPNHRYVTDLKLRNTMVGSGWIAEGYGPNAVMFCTPA